MNTSKRIFLMSFILLFAALACNTAAPGTPLATLDPNTISTLIAGTVSVAMTQTGVQQDVSLVSPFPTLTSTETFTPAPPTFTPTITSTPTLPFTSTPLVPLISVSVPTNCRKGPGKIYDYEGALLVGQMAQVYGRDPSGNYWYIRNPDDANGYCWLWGNYATLTGNYSMLPVYTPPPTPTATLTPTPSPSFNATYSSLDTCSSKWWIELKIKNNGSISFKSVDITIKDLVTDVSVTDLKDGFTDLDGCLKTTTKDVIAPGDVYLLSAPAFNYDPTGDKLRVWLTLCSGTGQKGQCVTDKFDVTP